MKCQIHGSNLAEAFEPNLPPAVSSSGSASWLCGERRKHLHKAIRTDRRQFDNESSTQLSNPVSRKLCIIFTDKGKVMFSNFSPPLFFFLFFFFFLFSKAKIRRDYTKNFSAIFTWTWKSWLSHPISWSQPELNLKGHCQHKPVRKTNYTHIFKHACPWNWF